MYNLYCCIEEGEPCYTDEPAVRQDMPVDFIIALGDYLTPSGVFRASDLRDDIAAAEASQGRINHPQ